MHINEQSTSSLKNTLKKWFPTAYAWTGTIENEEQLENLEKQKITNDITAIAGRSFDVNKVVFYQKIARENAGAKIDGPEEITIGKTGSDDRIYINITIENIGDAALMSRVPYPVHIAYHVLDENGDVVKYDCERTNLSFTIFPGEKAEEMMCVKLDDIINASCIQVDLVQEQNFWFEINKEIRIKR